MILLPPLFKKYYLIHLYQSQLSSSAIDSCRKDPNPPAVPAPPGVGTPFIEFGVEDVCYLEFCDKAGDGDVDEGIS